ncbi:unnamed protein product [Lactuca virosa]|uniref:Uncharacterized protein n=1 Tax=Lactuca virosa TaxID=75947 RepID=A0AAU9PKY4_9ASTR|nr:unnamed protein product [Lactuca virosa]
MESERETREDEAPTKALVIHRYMHLEVHMEITFVLQHTVNPMMEVLVVLLMGVLLEKKQTHAPYFQEWLMDTQLDLQSR